MKDPSRFTMLRTCLTYARRHGLDDDHDALAFDIEAAIYYFASDWHSGQASNLYAALSASPYRPGLLARSIADVGGSSTLLYDALCEHFV